MGIHAFGQEFLDKERQQTTFVALSHAGTPILTVDGKPMITPVFKQNQVPSDVPDPTAPDPKAPAPPLLIASTLTQIIADLNHRADAKEIYSVDAAYAAKHAIVAGAENAAPADIMNALAAVYGLRVIHPEHGIARLTHPLYMGAQEIGDLGKAVRSVLPDPFWRAIHTRVVVTQKESLKAHPMPSRPSIESDYTNAGEKLRQAAIREFRARVEPKVRRSKDQKLPLSALDEREKQLFVLITASQSLAEACWIADRLLPPYIADFDHVLLTGGVYQNEQKEERFSLFFSYPNPRTGQLYRGVGFGNARIPEQ